MLPELRYQVEDGECLEQRRGYGIPLRRIRPTRQSVERMNVEATVDRFEDGTAVLLVRPEERLRILIPRELVPGVREGDIVDVAIVRRELETEEARERVSSLIEKLRQKGV